MAERPLFREAGVSGRLSADLAALATRLGHDFAEPALLREALTHPSFAGSRRPSNQRLEFLGDRVLGLVIAEALLKADPGAAEGTLAPRLNALVRRETLAEIATELDLGTALKLGRSEMLSGGRRKAALLAAAVAALIAAIYLDGGFAPARDAVLRLWGMRIGTVEGDTRDAKTALQEWAQARGQRPPDYLEVARSGPDHAPLFEIEARLEDGRATRARAPSKRQAQQQAARSLLDMLEQEARQ
ncbi:MAG: ribonuclease III [Rhodobacteraceae bacterium]|nr:ribonuclease III [Paracoccaceae bacterium]